MTDELSGRVEEIAWARVISIACECAGTPRGVGSSFFQPHRAFLSQASHDEAHSLSMKDGLRVHSPDSAHARQPAPARSLHDGSRTCRDAVAALPVAAESAAQAWQHCADMNAGFLVHSPLAFHEAHCEFRSMHAAVTWSRLRLRSVLLLLLSVPPVSALFVFESVTTEAGVSLP